VMRSKNNCTLIMEATGKPKWICNAYNGNCKFWTNGRSRCQYVREYNFSDPKCTSTAAHIEILHRLEDIKS
jgi:hypothetical protein